MREPDFGNMLKVLRRQAPSRSTLFEFALNGPLYARLAGVREFPAMGTHEWGRTVIQGFRAAGYDYAMMVCEFRFPTHEFARLRSRSLNEGTLIHDRASFEAYPWPDPEAADYSRLESLAPELPEGMKFIVRGMGGVLENVIQLVGYERLCYMIMDEPALAEAIFEAVGSRFVRYYQIVGQHQSVGAMISNDDWGFHTQTMLAPEDLRKYVFPWHRRIVEAIHQSGRPAILHSCGNLAAVVDEIIDHLGYDAKHSYEDKIICVEDAYEKWGRRIAILGAMDVDFICRSTPQQVRARSRAMLQRTAERGGYALGTGNSVPEYVPQENYFAMIEAAQ